MTENTQKPERVQFPKGWTASQILDAIKAKQNKWAKEHPEQAHKLYPKVFDAQGNRIK